MNLGIERHLFEKSHLDSNVLFFYINRPCVVIGRNQNPWSEVNLAQLRSNALGRPIDLVRRRSGGGAVFHDHGNVNLCVIGPPDAFRRDRALETVVRAVQADAPRLRINERHDLILRPGADGEPERKVSGSAYKLTRTRAMHHATCLVDSPRLALISAVLRSPAAPYITARGVASVRSPVSNLFPGSGEQGVKDFIRKVVGQFSREYGLDRDHGDALAIKASKSSLEEESSMAYGLLDEGLLDNQEIRAAVEELKVSLSLTAKRYLGLSLHT